MDPSNSTTLSCISAVKNRKRKVTDRNVYVSMKIPAKRLYFTPPTHRQKWSLPEGIIYYMAKNPRSAKVYQNLTNSSKYFFAINPIIVCSKLTYIVPENTDGGNDKWKIKQGGEQQIIDLKNSSTKLWVTSKLDTGIDDLVADEDVNIKQDLISSIIPNIYRCEAVFLKLRNQTISFKEYKFLGTNVQHVDFDYVAVFDDNGTTVAFEKLIESCINVKVLFWFFNDDDTSVSAETVMNLLKISHFPTIEYFGLFNTPATFDLDTWFSYVKRNKLTNFNIDFSPVLPEAFFNDDDTSVSAETVMNLLKISHFPTIEYFGLFNTPATFDFDTWFTYAKRNKSTQFNIDFTSFLPAAYKTHVEEVIDEIIGTEYHEYIPPIVAYDGHGEEIYQKLCDMNFSTVF